MICACAVLFSSSDHSVPGFCRRSRPSASFIAIRDNHVDRLESPRNCSRWVKART